MDVKQKLGEYGKWLMKEAYRIVEGCKVTAFDGVTQCFTPDASAFYKALWTRDFFYMVDGVPECAADDEVRNACTFLLNGQREDGTIPDRRDADGVSIYSAGPYGSKLGEPPTDNASFMVKLVHHYVARTGDAGYFKNNSARLEWALNGLKRSEYGLVYIPPEIRRSSFGFIDQIAPSGNILFASLLFIEAARDMQRMYEMAGELKRAAFWKAQHVTALKNLEILWSEEEGLYLAADVDCAQCCIWGSCYAVYAGFVPKERAERISRRMIKDYDKAIRFGQVRHLFYPELWQRKVGLILENGEISPEPGTYQNGAYWSSASGWVSAVIRLTNEQLADQMLLELLEHYKRFGIYEAVNDEPPYRGALDYSISTTLVLQELRRIGIDTGSYKN